MANVAFDRARFDGYYSYMKKAGIAALKNNLSRYLDQVKGGETILVMDRNQPVAQIVPLPSAARGLVSDDDRLSRLERTRRSRAQQVACKASTCQGQRQRVARSSR
jgi:prevent-host-death family protein